MITGAIKLVDAAGDVLREELYRDRDGRDKVETSWWKIYGEERMERCFLHYEPDVPEFVPKREIDKNIKAKYVGRVYHIPK